MPVGGEMFKSKWSRHQKTCNYVINSSSDDSQFFKDRSFSLLEDTGIVEEKQSLMAIWELKSFTKRKMFSGGKFWSKNPKFLIVPSYRYFRTH